MSSSALPTIRVDELNDFIYAFADAWEGENGITGSVEKDCDAVLGLLFVLRATDSIDAFQFRSNLEELKYTCEKIGKLGYLVFFIDVYAYLFCNSSAGLKLINSSTTGKKVHSPSVSERSLGIHSLCDYVRAGAALHRTKMYDLTEQEKLELATLVAPYRCSSEPALQNIAREVLVKCTPDIEKEFKSNLAEATRAARKIIKTHYVK